MSALTVEQVDAALQARELWPDDPVTRARVAAEIAGWQPSRETLPGLLDELARSGTLIGRASDIDALVRRIARARAGRRHVDGDGPAFLGHGVSAGLRFDEANPDRLAALGLPVLLTAADLAAQLELDTAQLSWLTYHRGASTVDHYARFTIPKRSGGVRVIASPKPHLRRAQRWVLRHILAPLPVHPAATAFRPGGSVLEHARPHAGQAVVVRLDLQDFFATITLPRVKGLFRSLGYSEGIATILALLCTDPPRVAVTLDGQRRYVTVGAFQLPQGACTSPALTNVLARRLDARLAGLAAHYGFAYTRYADDLAFSASTDAVLADLLRGVRQVVADEGFAVNDAKTRVMRAPGRQVVTGLVVNDGARVSREDLRRFRAFLHACERDGLEAVSARIGKDAGSYARGYLAWVAMVSPTQAARLRARHPWLAGEAA